MSAFSKAGIYVWLDLDTFNTTIEQTAPTWTEEQFVAFAQVMDVFQGYDNLAGFWIGNEVINTAAGSPSAPYIKAAVTDMKSYMAAKKYRTIPIGYSAADIAELRPMLQNYLACGSHPEEAIDFFGLNSYEWCGDATYTTSGYANLQQMSETYNLPIFFSETGCNVPEPRTFSDQAAILGSNMINTWSGSIIYEWVEETNHYGIVTYPNGQIYSGVPIPLQPDYNNLANVWRDINPTGVSQSSYTPSFAAPACPLATAGWAVNGDVLLPTLGANVVLAVAASKVVLPSSPQFASSSIVRTTSTSASGTEIIFSMSVTASKTSSLVAATGSRTTGFSNATAQSLTVNINTDFSPTGVSPSSTASITTSSPTPSRMLSTSHSAIASTPESQNPSLSTTPISSIISSQVTGAESTSSRLSTSTHASSISAGSATTTTSSPSSATSHSSAQKLLISNRSTDPKDYWSLAHMINKSGWLITIILPVVGVLGAVSFL